MSDHFIAIVPVVKEYPNNKEKAKEILTWLINEQIVQPYRTDCILSPSLGYALEIDAKVVVEEPEYLPLSLKTNGLEIITEATVFHAGLNSDLYEKYPESNLGFTFWNWPKFKETFLDSFKEKLNCKIEIVYGMI